MGSAFITAATTGIFCTVIVVFTLTAFTKTASVATAPSTTAASCAATGFRRYPKRPGVGLVSVSKIIVRGRYRL